MRKATIILAVFILLCIISALFSFFFHYGTLTNQILPKEKQTRKSLGRFKYKKKSPTIVILASNDNDDETFNIMIALRSLDTYMYYDNFQTTVHVFYREGHLQVDHKKAIKASTRRSVSFHELTSTDDYHVSRFWITEIWKEPILDKFSTIMRVSADSCFVEDTDQDLPGFPTGTSYVYHANEVMTGDDELPHQFLEGLMEFTEAYIAAHRITVKNPQDWSLLKTRWHNEQRFVTFDNAFEVGNIDFFRQPMVMDFQKAASEAKYFGLFGKGWAADAPVRTISLALFADKLQVKGNVRPKGYMRQCPANFSSLRKESAEAFEILRRTTAEEEDEKNQKATKRIVETHVKGANYKETIQRDWDKAKLARKKGLVETGNITTKKGPAIAFLISNTTDDLLALEIALKSLDVYMHVDNFITPVLIFNEGNLNVEEKEFIKKSTMRQVLFPLVDFTEYPIGFDSKAETGNFYKRSKWGYQQISRFWITGVWEHPILDNYSSLMRINADSCFVEDTDSKLPGLPTKQPHVYHANRYSRENSRYIEGLIEFAEAYIITNNVFIENPGLWSNLKKRWEDKTFISLYNNFEVCNITFFRQPMVMAFQRAVTEEKPFGVFRKRWSDAAVRTLTLLFFADKSWVKGNVRPKGYMHPCPST